MMNVSVQSISTRLRTSILAGLFLLTLSPFAGAVVVTTVKTGDATTVEKVEGGAYYLNADGKEVTIKKGDSIPLGTTIYTGEKGKVIIKTVEGKSFSYGPEYEIKLKKVRKFNQADLFRGSSESIQNKGLGRNPGNMKGDKPEPEIITRTRTVNRSNTSGSKRSSTNP
jgi:hypothetical protein